MTNCPSSPSNAVRIAHIADLHLDADHIDDAITCLEFAVETAIERQCKAFVIAGDIWDRAIAVDERSPLLPAVRLIRSAAESMDVVIVRGNHDRPGSLAIFQELGRPRIWGCERPLSVPAAGIEFACIPYPTKAFLVAQTEGSQDDTDNLAGAALEQIVRGFAAQWTYPASPRVLVYHGTVTGAQTETGQTMLGGDVMISAAALEASGADYVALGHIHKRQKLGRICYYSGSLYHVNFGELDRKVMLIADVWRGGCEVEDVELPSRPKVMIDWYHPSADAYESGDWPDCRDADVKLRVRLTEEEAALFNEGGARMMLTEAGAHSVRVERIIIPRERIRAVAVTEARQLRDKVAAWGEAIGEEMPAGVLAKADTVEAGEVVS